MEFLVGFLLGVGGVGVAVLLMLSGGTFALSARLKSMEEAITTMGRRDDSDAWKDGTVEGDWS